MKRFMWFSILFASVFLFAGCSSKTKTLGLDGQVFQAIEPQSVWLESGALESIWSGYFVGGVIVSQETKLLPIYYKEASAYAERREECEQMIANGYVTDDCTTENVITVERVDGERFPKELIWTKSQPKQAGPEKIVVGCSNETAYYGAPMRRLTEGFSTIISHANQRIIMQAAEQSAALNIRINKNAYDVSWEGGSNCDLYFSNLEILD